MRRLWLDYQQPDPARHRPGIALLLASLAVGGVLLAQYLAVAAELDVEQGQVARLQREAARQPPSAAADGRRTEAGAAAPAAGRWEEMFAALEAAADETMTLLALQPGTAELRISGEARNLAAVLDYVKRLQAAPLFANVLLTQSEVVQDDPRHPIRFALSTEWRGAPR